MFNGKLISVFQSSESRNDASGEWAATVPASFDPLRQSDLVAAARAYAFLPTAPMDLPGYSPNVK